MYLSFLQWSQPLSPAVSRSAKCTLSLCLQQTFVNLSLLAGDLVYLGHAKLQCVLLCIPFVCMRSLRFALRGPPFQIPMGR